MCHYIIICTATKVYWLIDFWHNYCLPAVSHVFSSIYRTEIEWYPGKCLTQKILKKKPKKGSKNAKPITKTEQCESFFNFFCPPQVPEDEEDIDEDAVSTAICLYPLLHISFGVQFIYNYILILTGWRTSEFDGTRLWCWVSLSDGNLHKHILWL